MGSQNGSQMGSLGTIFLGSPEEETLLNSIPRDLHFGGGFGVALGPAKKMLCGAQGLPRPPQNGGQLRPQKLIFWSPSWPPFWRGSWRPRGAHSDFFEWPRGGGDAIAGGSPRHKSALLKSDPLIENFQRIKKNPKNPKNSEF